MTRRPTPVPPRPARPTGGPFRLPRLPVARFVRWLVKVFPWRGFIELAGVALLALALAWVHVAVGIALLGLYLVLMANDTPARRARRGRQ